MNWMFRLMGPRWWACLAVAAWSKSDLGKDDGGAMVLLSPRRYAHFAAYQLARLL